MAEPLYTAENCTPAYQLDWSYSVFWRNDPIHFAELDQLKELTENDGIRILQHEFQPPTVSQLLISTLPSVSPLRIAQRVKGRWQHLLRQRLSRPFRRNYALRSVGSARRDVIEQYLRSQCDKHEMADPRVQERLQQFQINQPDVDLSQPSQTSHAQYWYNLHLVLVHKDRDKEIGDEPLRRTHDMVLGASRKKGRLLSRGAILADHLHLAMRCHIEESPEEVALSYMNNLAHVRGMKAVFKYSFYVGTFSEYDLGVIPRP